MLHDLIADYRWVTPFFAKGFRAIQVFDRCFYNAMIIQLLSFLSVKVLRSCDP